MGSEMCIRDSFKCARTIRLEQIYNSGSFQNRYPVLNCRLTYPDVSCYVGIIEKFTCSCSNCRQKFGKCNTICRHQFIDIPLQISCNVRRIIFLPVPVYIIKLGIRSFVDNFPYIVIFYNLFFTFFDICIGWDKMPVKFYTINLPHG